MVISHKIEGTPPFESPYLLRLLVSTPLNISAMVIYQPKKFLPGNEFKLLT